MEHEQPWMERPLHWVSVVWMIVTPAGGGRTHDRYTRVGVLATGTIFTAFGTWFVIDGAPLWGASFLILGLIQLVPLGLYYLSRATQKL